MKNSEKKLLAKYFLVIIITAPIFYANNKCIDNNCYEEYTMPDEPVIRFNTMSQSPYTYAMVSSVSASSATIGRQMI